MHFRAYTVAIRDTSYLYRFPSLKLLKGMYDPWKYYGVVKGGEFV